MKKSYIGVLAILGCIAFGSQTIAENKNTTLNCTDLECGCSAQGYGMCSGPKKVKRKPCRDASGKQINMYCGAFCQLHGCPDRWEKK